MGSSRSILLIFILAVIIDLLLAPTTAQVLDGTCTSKAEFCRNCSDIGTYGNGSSYQQNLNKLLSSFSSTPQLNGGFYNSSLGQGPNQVNAIALCRGDHAVLDECHTCFDESNSILLQNCSYQKEAIIWAESCMVRYSSNLILGVKKDKPLKYVPGPNSARNPEQFNLVLNPLLETLSDRAASGGSLKKFAAGYAYVPGFETIYALVQCTPDIDKQTCSDCLKDSISHVPTCCAGKQGGRVLKPSCNLRFESDPFFNITAGSLVNLPDQGNKSNTTKTIAGKKSNTTKTIISIVVPVAVVIILIVSICMILRGKKQSIKLGNDTSDEISRAESLQYNLDTVRSATNDFSDANKLGQGGFGAVYKGRLFNGKDIAVKRLSQNSQQGDREFKNEVMLVAQLQHRNLVRLLGFCLEAKERLLIFEYLPNSSLDHFLIDPLKRANLNWETRYKIIRGIARGLLYLHEDSRLRIIHRDLKPNNILLDEDMNPKIADFGIARLFLVDESQGDTRTIAGTYGYMAPEYAMYGNFSVKSDVYSFGVLVIEIMSGQRINKFQGGENEEDLLNYVWRNWREDTVSNIIDPILELGTGSASETMRWIHIGLLCVDENVSNRPTMASVVAMLNSHSLTLSVPSGPPLRMQTGTRPDVSLELTESDKSKSSVNVSRNEVSITELLPH